MRGYTLAQVRAFSEAAQRAYRRRLADQLVNLRAAQFETNDYKRFLTKLQD